MQNFCIKPVSKFKRKSDFYKKLLVLDYVLENGRKSVQITESKKRTEIEYIYYGMVKSHKIHCVSPTCGCKLILENKLPSQDRHIREKEEASLREFVFIYIKDFMQDTVQAMPSRSEIKVAFANFLFENKVECYATAITLLHGSKLAKKSLELNVVGSMLLTKISNKVECSYESNINMKDLTDYHKLANELRRNIENNIKKFIEFWGYYKEPEPLLKKLYDMSISVNKEGDQINKLWHKISTEHVKLSHSDYLLYGLHQSLIRSAPHSGEKVFQKYLNLYSIYSLKQSKESQVSIDNIHESKNVVLYISMQRENLGEILFSTPNVENISTVRITGNNEQKHTNTNVQPFSRRTSNRSKFSY